MKIERAGSRVEAGACGSVKRGMCTGSAGPAAYLGEPALAKPHPDLGLPFVGPLAAPRTCRDRFLSRRRLQLLALQRRLVVVIGVPGAGRAGYSPARP